MLDTLSSKFINMLCLWSTPYNIQLTLSYMYSVCVCVCLYVCVCACACIWIPLVNHFSMHTCMCTHNRRDWNQSRLTKNLMWGIMVMCVALFFDVSPTEVTLSVIPIIIAGLTIKLLINTQRTMKLISLICITLDFPSLLSTAGFSALHTPFYSL